MRIVQSTFSTKRQFLDAGVAAWVSYIDKDPEGKEKEITCTVDKCVPCKVLNGEPRKMVSHAFGDKDAVKEALRAQGALQPSWTAMVYMADGRLVME